jgi:hypothetical protein
LLIDLVLARIGCATALQSGGYRMRSRPNEPGCIRARRTDETTAEERPMSPSTIRLLTAAGCVAAALFGAGPTVSFAAEDQVTTEPSAKECIADLDTGYSDEAGKYFFTMNFQNNCDRPIKCTIDAYITSYRGAASAHTVLHFPPREQTPAQKSYAVQVKAMGGVAQYGRDCSFI